MYRNELQEKSEFKRIEKKENIKERKKGITAVENKQTIFTIYLRFKDYIYSYKEDNNLLQYYNTRLLGRFANILYFN